MLKKSMEIFTILRGKKEEDDEDSKNNEVNMLERVSEIE
jgi:hypothetical protein